MIVYFYNSDLHRLHSSINLLKFNIRVVLKIISIIIIQLNILKYYLKLIVFLKV